MLTLETIISLIAPHQCVRCGSEGSLICATCRHDCFPALPDRCYRCHSLTRDSRVCSVCRRRTNLSYVWICTGYEDVAKELVSRMKFARARTATAIIGEAIASRMPYVLPDCIVVPVPTAATRVRQRGYDHAALIAKEVARYKGIEMKQFLRRLGNTRQVGATRDIRLTQLNGALYVTHPSRIDGKDIVLVDDVITSGGSIEQAAHVLRKSGARSVSAAIFAKKQ